MDKIRREKISMGKIGNHMYTTGIRGA